MGQIHAHQLGSGCKGVVLVNIAEAIPYFGLSKPVSQFGVALLILDHHDPRLPSNCPITKVPAKCVATGEPLIVSAAVLQIGQQEVVRNTPSQCLEVPEVSNSVVRVQVYKDQSTADWDEFIQKPVKHLLSLKPFSEVASGDILDVWDRQYMTMRLTRVPVQEAQLFMVNIRVEATALPTIMQANGQEGRYFEVRTSDGRHPDEEHKTIWLPGKTFAEAQLLQRTSTIAASLVRQGDRYGLRTDKSKAEELHKIHRPDLVYIPGEELRRYKVGPMPFGSTKQSLVHIFQKWNWSARPIGPHAQAGDRSGAMWNVQAATEPTHWIFQLAHGDVLISPDDKPTSSDMTKPTIVASAKTMHSLQAKPKDQPKEDPWLHDDPWRGSVNKGPREMSVGQVASIQASLEKSILEKINHNQGEDEEMTGNQDQRIAALEQKFEQLSAQVTGHQVEQTRHNQQVQAQVQNLDHKIDQQQHAFHAALDSKLEQQMARIEQLFTKRPRMGE